MNKIQNFNTTTISAEIKSKLKIKSGKHIWATKN